LTDGFLRALAAALRNQPVIGDGTLHRAVRALQREFWRPPQSTKDLVVHRQPSGPAIECARSDSRRGGEHPADGLADGATQLDVNNHAARADPRSVPAIAGPAGLAAALVGVIEHGQAARYDAKFWSTSP
jgi:hypothetical protein